MRRPYTVKRPCSVRMDANVRSTESFVKVERRDDQEGLAAAYQLWDACAEEDDTLRVARDDADNDESTILFLAQEGSSVVGAARMLRVGHNVRVDRVAVLPRARGKGVGRLLVEKLLRFAAPVEGAVFVRATAWELGFYSILGFEVQGNEVYEGGIATRVMVYRFPICAPATGCVGLHHTSIRVSDIEKSLAFYGSIGFFVTEKFMTAAGSRACFVEGLGARLEFVEAPDGRGGLTGVQGIPPAGFGRLVFDVTKACTDLQVYLDHLKRRNGGHLSIAAPPAQQVIGSQVVSVATIEDVDGLPIEFIRREASVPSALRTRVDW